MANTYPTALSRNTRNTLIYADAISAVYAWWDLIADPSYALREDLDIWEVARRDPAVYQGMQQRLNAVAGREYRVMPSDDTKSEAAKIKASVLDAMLRRIPHFQDARRRLATSIFRGQAVELITGRRQFMSLDGRPSMNWWVCTGLRNIDPRRFIIKPERERRPDGTTRIRSKLYMSVVPTYQTLPTATKRNSAGPIPEGRRRDSRELYMGRYLQVKNPEWFVRIVYNDEEARLGFGHGVLDAVYFTLWCKQVVMREGLQGLERFVHGVPIVTIDPTKRGSTAQTSESIKDAALAALKKMRAGHAFVLNQGETLQWAEPGGTGNQMVMGMLEYLDRRLMAVLTGASLRSGGNPGETGSYASDAVGMEMSDNMVQYDRDKIDEDITLDLLGLLDRLNRPQFEALGKILKIRGLADAPPGKFVTVVKRKLDPATVMSMVQGASQIDGLDLLKSEVYDQLGFTMPTDKDDVLKGRAPAAPAIDPSTGMPLPPGMPEPEAASAQEDEEPGPEDNEGMFGSGAPEDDDSLFGGDGNQEAAATMLGESEEDPSPEEVMPELELGLRPGGMPETDKGKEPKST